MAIELIARRVGAVRANGRWLGRPVGGRREHEFHDGVIQLKR